MASAGSSPRLPSAPAESTINNLRAQLAFQRALSNTLRGYLRGWECSYQVWREDFERFRHQDAEIHQLEHDLALERRENQRLRRENDILHEECELQYLRNSDPWGNGRTQQATERHWGAPGNSRESARTFPDHSIVAVRRDDPALGFYGRADAGSDGLYEAEEYFEEADEEEPMPQLQENFVDTSEYEAEEGFEEADEEEPMPQLQENFIDTSERPFDEEDNEYDGDTMADEDSGYGSATAVDSSDESDSERPGGQMDDDAEYDSEAREGTRSQRSGSESSGSGGSDTGIIFPTMGDGFVRTLTRLAIVAVHRIRSMRHRTSRA